MKKNAAMPQVRAHVAAMARSVMAYPAIAMQNPFMR